MPLMFGERDLEAMQRLRTRVRSRRASRIPASSSRRRGSAARCPARTARIRSRGPGLPSVSERPRILEHEPGDLTVIVEAGLRLSDAPGRARRARPAALARPARRPDARRVPRSTISPGRCRHRFGAMRDLVIGVTVVARRTARVASSGGKVVKNVAGYDLGKLFCGSRGRLGAVERRRAAAAPAARGRGARWRPRRSAVARAAPLAARTERRRPRRRPDGSCCSRAARARSTRRSRQLGGEEADAAGRRCAALQSRLRPASPLGRRCGAARPARAPASPTSSGERGAPRGASLAERVVEATVQPELIADCVHCGFCLPTCPTYELWHEEMDSPRGRIWLMGGLVDGTVELNRHGRRALRPLPRLHGVRHLVPVRRASTTG